MKKIVYVIILACLHYSSFAQILDKHVPENLDIFKSDAVTYEVNADGSIDVKSIPRPDCEVFYKIANYYYNEAEKIFVIPEGNQYLLYAPLSKSVLCVNAAVIRSIKAFKEGNLSLDNLDRRFVEQLKSSGVLVPKSTERLTNRFPIKQMQPNGITLFLTTQCSMRCSYCYAGGGDNQKTMSWSIACTAITGSPTG